MVSNAYYVQLAVPPVLLPQFAPLVRLEITSDLMRPFALTHVLLVPMLMASIACCVQLAALPALLPQNARLALMDFIRMARAAFLVPTAVLLASPPRCATHVWQATTSM